MTTYKVTRFTVRDKDGNVYSSGDTVELSDEYARFYGARIEPADDPQQEADFEQSDTADGFDALPDDVEFPYHYGGGNYYLSDGSKVSGKQKAIEAQQDIDDG